MSSPNTTESSNTAVSSPAERRRNLRFPFSATVEAIESKSGARIAGRTSDLGLGGCYIDTLSPFPVGTEAKIRIVRNSESFEAQVKVIYSQIGMGMGLAFVSAQPKQVRLFQRWLLEISGKSAPVRDAPEEPPAERSNTLNNVVLSDLIMTLMQKKTLTEAEGKGMLRKLFR
jgi:PilZ domain